MQTMVNTDELYVMIKRAVREVLHDELEELVPHSTRDDDDVWLEVVGEFAIFVHDEKEQKVEDDELTEEE